MYFDTHAHFEHAEGDDGIDAIVERAAAARVTRILAVGATPELNASALLAASRHPEHVTAAVGFDRDQAAPHCAAPDRDIDAELHNMIADAATAGGRVAAIGETGLDYHYTPDTREAQLALFRRQLDIARETALPVIVHSREADADTLEELTRHRKQWSAAPERIGVLHCFTGDAAFAKALLALDFHLSFSGIVSFRNADRLREVARHVPADKLLIETDAPYLAPVPHRGRRNEPALLPHVAAAVAAARGTTPECIADLTLHNGQCLFDPA